MNTFFGTKINSTSLFTEKGRRQVVTLINAGPLTVKQIKTAENDGYSALQVAFNKIKREILLSEPAAFKIGDQIKAADVFKDGDIVKITGISKGRGFAGGVKRYGFHGGPKTHGQSDRHRAPGSIGMRTTPGRLWKGKRMAGHYGVETITVRNLKVVKVEESNITVSGTVPGGRNGLLILTKKI